MAKVNYRHLKKRREEEQKKQQSEKLQRRGRVPDAAPGSGSGTGGPPRPGSA